MVIEFFSNKTRQWITKSDANGRGNGKHGDGSSRLRTRQITSSNRHGNGQKTQPEALQSSTDDEFVKVLRDRGKYRAEKHNGEGHQQNATLVGTVGEATHDWRRKSSR